MWNPSSFIKWQKYNDTQNWLLDEYGTTDIYKAIQIKYERSCKRAIELLKSQINEDLWKEK